MSNPVNGVDVFDVDEIDIDDFVEDGEHGSKVLRLEYPFSVTLKDGKETITENVEHLEFRRPRGIDMEKLDRMGEAASLKDIRGFVAGLVIEPKGISSQRIGDLDAFDMMRATKVCFGFFPKPRSVNTGSS